MQMISKNVRTISDFFSLFSARVHSPVLDYKRRNTCPSCFLTAALHMSSRVYGLDEFFDEKDNWGKMEVRVGRAWRTSELRLKSNSDLHKLWYILLKEKNMLLTMETAYGRDLMPNPERMYKVKESMQNLEDVIRERNKAYFELETGETGERRCTTMTSALGMDYVHKVKEYPMPKWMNEEWHVRHPEVENDPDVDEFRVLYREKQIKQEEKQKGLERRYVIELMKRFPNLDLEYVKEKFPHVDVEKLKNHKDVKVPWVPK